MQPSDLRQRKTDPGPDIEALRKNRRALTCIGFADRYLEAIGYTRISQVIEYLEIFLARMTACRRAARVLNCEFNLFINTIRMA